MRSVMLIGHHDARLFLRDRTSFIWLILVPLVFTWFLSRAVPPARGPADARPAVVIDNQDAGFMGRVFLHELGAQGLSLRSPDAAADTRRRLTIPAEFTQRVLAREPVSLGFSTTGSDSDGAGEIVRLRLWRALLALNAHLAREALDHPDRPPAENALIALIDAPVPVTLKSSHAGRKPRPVGFSFSVPGNLVGYVFFNLLVFGGATVARERREGVLRRAAIHPVTQTQLLFGKLYGLMLLGGVQSLVLLAFGQFVFGVALADNLPGVLLTLLIFTWVAASVGLLIGFLVRAEDKVVGLCVAVALAAAALGGCWWPLEFAPPVFRQLALLVPTGWALDALHQFITFGAGIPQALPALGVLVVFGAAANLAAARCFRV